MLKSNKAVLWLALLATAFTSAQVTTHAQPYAPADVGTTVNGFQDDFNGPPLGANWTPTGPSTGIYSVSNGFLHVTQGSGDPNHLLYTAPGYDNTVQEVLLRIRVTNFGSNADPPRAGAGVGVDGSTSQGINFFFRDFNGEGQTGRHVAILDDLRAWGTGYGFTWQNNTWYWMRLRQEPNAPAQGGANDIFCKIWPADGSVAEPATWQISYEYTSIRSTRTGFAGIAAGSLDGISEFDVDYVLIKAGGLPAITVSPGAFIQIPAQITNQPVSQTVTELLPATFTVGVSGNPWPTMQWYKNDNPIPGATSTSYSIPMVPLSDNGARFEVVVANVASNITYTVTSSVVTLTVNADLTPPTLLGAQALGLSQVQVLFSERITPLTATNVSNYAITATNGALVSVASILLDSSQSNAILYVSTLVESAIYTLTVNGLTDLSVTANRLATNSQVTFMASSFAPAAIGNPSPPGNSLLVPGGYNVTGGGNDIGGSADQLQFSYVPRTGDFDLKVRLDSLSQADVWTEAGLVARETLDPGSRFAGVLATPSISGTYFQSRLNLNGASTTIGSFPPAFPNTWLRLKRVGNLFTGYAGIDGENWTQLGSVTLTVAANIYLGFAVCSHNPSQTATAAFRDFSTVTTAGSSAPPPFEPLSQSSRRTSMVISEIMYHPPEVIIGSNQARLEFVELFNSLGEPFDLSGYRLSGDVDYTFPANTIVPAGAFLVVARCPADLQAVYGYSAALGPWNGTNALPNGSGTIRLRHRTGAIFLEVNYSSQPPWPAAADGAGHSLVLSRPSYGEGDSRAWGLSESILGSPGRLDPVTSDPLRNVMINELLSHADSNQADFIELYNSSARSLDLSGCILSDSPSVNKFVIPGNTFISAHGFVCFAVNNLGETPTNLNFGLKSSGDTVYFRNPANTRVLDAVRFGAQARGVSYGRSPDGSPNFCELSSQTPGAYNAPPLLRDIVINEIMYNPISRNDDFQYVELYNRGSNLISLAGWKFVDGISFTFPGNAVIPADGYVVVARSTNTLRLSYPALNANNLFGNFAGKLSHGGEHLALAMPDEVLSTNSQHQLVTNINYVVVNEVTYLDGGRWPQFADGGGSSLELIDPGSDNRLAPNWADSDETAKAGWTFMEVTGVADNGNVAADQLQVLLQGSGECLIDNVEVVPKATGINAVANGSFQSSAAGWTAEGTEAQSGWDSTGGYTNSPCYHVRAVDRGDNQVNRIRTPLTTSLVANSTNTIRARVRWLKGHPEILFRIRGNWLEAVGTMNLPANLGTPGEPNSRSIPNAPPAIYDVSHSPIVPAASQSVTVTARVHDPDGLASVFLKYRLDPNISYVSIPMVDDGTGADASGGDGLYTATIPGQAAGVLVAFCVQATDLAAPPATSTFPNDAPVRECLVRFGESIPAGNLPVHFIWMTQSTFSNWSSRNKLNNTPNDLTFVSGNSRAIYNAAGRFAGSPYIALSSYNTPTGNRCGYKFDFAPGEQFLGSASLVTDFPGGHPNAESTGIQENMSYWIADHIDMPYSHRYPIRLIVNGVLDMSRGGFAEAVFKPDGEYLATFWPGAESDLFFRVDRGYEFSDAGGLVADPMPRLEIYNTPDLFRGGTNLMKKTARYRWNWNARAYVSNNDYTHLFELVDAVNAPGPEPYTSHTLDLADVEEWMQFFGVNHIINNFDSYGHLIGKNSYAFKPKDGKWKLLLFDVDWTMMVSDNWTAGMNAATGPLFASDDPLIARMYTNPPFTRAYYRVLQDAVDGPLNPAICNPVMDAKYNSLVANGITRSDGQALANPANLKTWFATRRTALLAVLASNAVPFKVAGTNFLVTNTNILTLTGTAPIKVKTVSINGISWPVTWTTITNWSLNLVLNQPTNQVTLVGYDNHGRPVDGGTNTVTLVCNAQLPALPGTIVFNEIMYHPQVTNAVTFVELFNTSSNFSFDLSGWRINGLGGYTFPGGTVITNRQQLILAKNRADFAAVYGANIPVFDEYSGTLQNNGETLTLIKPGPAPGDDLVIDKVRYEAAPPWPQSANGLGCSLQLVDPAQDNARVGNWAAGALWRYFSATAGAGSISDRTLYIYPADSPCDLYLDDIRLVFGSDPDAGTNLLRNAGFETGTATNWSVRGGTANIYVTNTVSQSGSYSIRLSGTNFGNPSISGIAQPIPGFLANTNYTLSYWYLPNFKGSNLLAKISFSGARFVVTNNNLFAMPYTPGASNLVASTLPPFPPLWLNEVQPQNLNTRTNRFGQYAPWVELYNAGTNSESLSGCYLANNYTSNQLQWPFPADALIAPGEFKIIWLDAADSNSIPAELHASFTIPESTGSVALVRLVNSAPQVIDYLNYSGVGAGLSYGDYPDAQPFSRQIFFNVTPKAANDATHRTLYINEWLASNVQNSTNGIPGFPDPADGDYDDWFELYNPNPFPVNLNNFFLTDTTNDPAQFRVPAGYIVPPNGFLLVWADGETSQNDPANPGLHVNFQLSRTGEQIALYDPNTNLVDLVDFGPQTNNISQGRYGDGTANFYYLPNPTPAAPNIWFANHPPTLAPVAGQVIPPGQLSLVTNIANDPDLPAQILTFHLIDPPVGASINAASGLFSWMPLPDQSGLSPQITVWVEDNGLPRLSATNSFSVLVSSPRPEITITNNDSEIILSVPTLPGRHYRIEFQETLVPGAPWQPVPGYENYPASGTTLTVPLTITTAPTTFYRILLLD